MLYLDEFEGDGYNYPPDLETEFREDEKDDFDGDYADMWYELYKLGELE